MAKPVIDSYLKVDIRCWRREGMLVPGVKFTQRWDYGDGRAISLGVSVGVDHITLWHWNGSCHLVYLDWFQAGVRAWQPFFLCPSSGCSRRVTALYSGGGVFACRYCHQLVYRAQRERADARAARRANKIRERLGWPIGILSRKGGKPCGMRWSTFERLAREHDTCVRAALGCVEPHSD